MTKPESPAQSAATDTRERTSYLTADEVQAAQTLHKRAPYALCHVSRGFFSIARYYGGCKFQGCHYTYMTGHDECVRDDVLRLVAKLRKGQGCREDAPRHPPRPSCSQAGHFWSEAKGGLKTCLWCNEQGADE